MNIFSNWWATAAAAGFKCISLLRCHQYRRPPRRPPPPCWCRCCCWRPWRPSCRAQHWSPEKKIPIYLTLNIKLLNQNLTEIYNQAIVTVLKAHLIICISVIIYLFFSPVTQCIKSNHWEPWITLILDICARSSNSRSMSSSELSSLSSSAS